MPDNSRDLTAAPQPADTPLPRIVTETKFMQNYRIASAVNGGGEVVAVRNGSGDVELFTIGSDGTVWNFYPDTTSATGYSGVSTGLQGATVSVGVDAEGHIVVFAGSGLQLFYVVEINSAPSRWSTPATVRVPPPPNAGRIARVVAQEIAGQLYVGVLTRYNSAGGPLYSLAVSTWQTQQPTFNKTLMNVSSTNCVWLGNTAQSAAFACVDNIITAYVVATGQVTRYPMAATFQCVSVDSATDSAGNDQVFAVLADGNAYHLIGGANGQPYSWMQMSQGMSFRQIMVDVDGSGSAQFFAVSGDNGLYHWEPLAQSPTGYSSPPVNIRTNVALVGLAGNDGGGIDLFAVGTAQNTLTHIFQDEAGTNWQAEKVETPAGGKVEEYVSYTSDLTVSDPAGALLVNTPVLVWASEETRVTVNGATYFVDAHRPARVSTNGGGMVSLAQETGTLAVPALQLNFPSLMTPDASIAVRQADVVQARLAATQGSDLMTAKGADGNFLLADQYRNTQTTDSLASAFNKCMNLTGATPAGAAYLLTAHGPKPGLFSRPSGSAADLRQLIRPAVEQHWQLSFAGGRVVYRDLTAGEASALLAEKRASIQSAFGVFDWIEDVGDFLVGVVDGVINVVDTVITTVVGGVKAAITFVVNGVTYLYEQTVSLINQAFDFVEMIFAQVKVFFEKIFEWLGFLFDWPDILRTHKALVYCMNQMVGFLQGSAAGFQRIVDNGFDNLQGRIATIFDYAVGNIAGSATVGGYVDANKQSDPQVNSALSNNIVLNNFIDNGGSVTSSLAAEVALDGTDPLSQLMQQFENFASNMEGSSAFASAQTYFQNLGGSPDQIFSQLLAGLLRVAEGVIQAVIAGAKALVDALLQLVQTIIAGIQSMLNEKWDIPFVSQFYSWIADGADLTPLDLIALIAAVPATILYKAIEGRAPFPDGDSVTAFTNSFSAQTMLNAAGLGTSRKALRGRAEADSWTGAIPPDDAKIMAIFGCASTCIYAIVTAVNDAFPKEAWKPLSWAAWLLEIAGQFLGCPWWYSAGSASCDPNNADGSGRTLWIFQNVGLLLDAVFLKLEGRLPENANDVGVGVQFLYSIVHMTLAIQASEAVSGAPVAVNILPATAEMSKLLRLTGVQAATGEASCVALAVIDGVSYFAAGITGLLLQLAFINQHQQPGLALAAVGAD